MFRNRISVAAGSEIRIDFALQSKDEATNERWRDLLKEEVSKAHDAQSAVSAGQQASQSKPDFSGVWTLKDPPTFGPIGIQAGEVYTIEHRDPSITIGMAVKDGWGFRTLVVKGATDGREYSQTVDGNPAIFIAKWEGDALTWETNRKTSSATLHDRRTMRLSQDGKVIIASRTRLLPAPVEETVETWDKHLLDESPLRKGGSIQELEPGVSIEQDLAGGGAHTYSIGLRSGQFLHLVLETTGITTDGTLFAPDGQPAAVFDGTNLNEKQSIDFIASASGVYRLELRSFERANQSGRYIVRIQDLRPATDVDRARVAGETAFQQGRTRTREGSRTLAARDFDEALTLFRQIGDREREADTLIRSASIHGQLGDKQKAEQQYEEALELIRPNNDRRREAEAMFTMGGSYQRWGEVEQSNKSYSEALKISEILGNRPDVMQVLYSLGSSYSKQGNHKKAMEAYTKLVNMAQSSGDSTTLLRALPAIAPEYLALEDRDGALKSYRVLLALLRSFNDRAGEATTLNSIGQLVFANRYDNEEALKYYSRALELARSARARSTEAYALANIGLAHTYLHQYDKAFQDIERSLSISREIVNHTAEAVGLSTLGLVYEGLNEPSKAIDVLNQALRLWRSIGNRDYERFTLGILARIHITAGDFGAARELWNRAVTLAKILKNRAWEETAQSELANLNQNIPNLLLSKGKTREALDFLSQSLTEAVAKGNYHEQHLIFDRLRNLYEFNLQDRGRTFDLTRRELVQAQASQDKTWEAATLLKLGDLHSLLKADALESYQKALSLYRADKDPKGEIDCLKRIAGLYGNSREGIAYMDEALKIARSEGDRLGEAEIEVRIAWLASPTTSAERVRHFDNASQIVIALPDNSIGKAMGQPDQNILIIVDQIVNAYRMDGQTQKAAEFLQQVVSKNLAGTADALPIWRFRLSLLNAQLLKEKGSLQEARRLSEEAIRLVESGKLLSWTNIEGTLVPADGGIYSLYSNLLILQNKYQNDPTLLERALESNEKYRARALVKGLSQSTLQVQADEAIRERESAIRETITKLTEERVHSLGADRSVEELGAIDGEIARLTSDYQYIRSSVSARTAGGAIPVQPEPLSIDELHHLMDEQTVLLEYALFDDRSYLWVVTSSSVQGVELPNRKEIETKATDLYQLLTVRGNEKEKSEPGYTARMAQSEERYHDVARDLGELILRPVASLINGKRLLVVADGALQYVPFGALPDPNGLKNSFTPLIVEHEIVNLPSASVLAAIRKQSTGRAIPEKTVAVLADPVFSPSDARLMGGRVAPSNSASLARAGRDMYGNSGFQRAAMEVGLISSANSSLARIPFSRQEAEAVMAYVRPEQRLVETGFQANLDVALHGEHAKYRIVHFATHGISGNNAALSGLILSLYNEQGEPQNGFLKLQDVYSLHLPAELVVLSACRTALGPDSQGEGFMGLARAFVWAGSKRVVASLWNVDDVATAELMTHFYHGLFSERLSPAAALRAAQIAMWKGKIRRSAYYWAGFILEGEYN